MRTVISGLVVWLIMPVGFGVPWTFVLPPETPEPVWERLFGSVVWTAWFTLLPTLGLLVVLLPLAEFVARRSDRRRRRMLFRAVPWFVVSSFYVVMVDGGDAEAVLAASACAAVAAIASATVYVFLAPDITPETDDRSRDLRGKFDGGFKEAAEHIRRYLDARCESGYVYIEPPDERFKLTVGQGPNGPIDAMVQVVARSEAETNVRRFLASRDFELEPDMGMPADFVPGVPVHVFIDIRPLPATSDSTCELIIALLREALRVSDETPISVSHYA